MSLRQFEVFENPSPRARAAFPYVVVLQSAVAETGADVVVAPLALRPPGHLPQHLFPTVQLAGRQFAVLVLGLTTLQRRLLTRSVGVLDHDVEGERIKKALDYLFLGL
jgi:toxin CcdB